MPYSSSSMRWDDIRGKATTGSAVERALHGATGMVMAASMLGKAARTIPAAAGTDQYDYREDPLRNAARRSNPFGDRGLREMNRYSPAMPVILTLVYFWRWPVRRRKFLRRRSFWM